MVTFTSAAAKRIAAVVRRVEATPIDRTAQPSPGGPGESSFFAWITGCDASGKRYNWARVFPDMSSDSPDLVLDTGMKWRLFGEPPVTGFESAYELNGERGISDRIVELRFAGFNAEQVACYVFAYTVQQPGGGLPIHDHRDNANGGFSFAVYSPGTSLPQQPWAV